MPEWWTGGPSHTVRRWWDGRRQFVELHGEIDVLAVPPGSDFLDGTPGARADTVVDLRDVTFIDGSGLNALLRTAVRLSAARHRLAVVVTDPLHRRLLHLVGLGPDTTLHTTVPEADPAPDGTPPRPGHDTPAAGTTGGRLRAVTVTSTGPGPAGR